MYQTDPPRSAKEYLPTMYDLPSEDPEEAGLPDEFHLLQPELLRLTFRPPEISHDEIFVASDMNLYFDVRHPLWQKRPDWFAVLGVSRLYEQKDLRLSYVVWQEGVYPYLVVELISPGTEQEDLGQSLRDVNKPPTKWEVYEQILRIPYYFVFNRYTNEFRAFGLVKNRYEELEITGQGVWLPEAKLGLGLWQGIHQNIERDWLRFYNDKGDWVLTAEEQERKRADELENLLAQYKQQFGDLA
jgi:Uma2 family endonuclease